MIFSMVRLWFGPWFAYGLMGCVYIVNEANFVAGEYENSTLRIQGPAVGQRDRSSRV